MRFFQMIAVFIAMVAAASCSAPPAQELGRADADAIRQLAQDLQAAYNAKDVAKTASFFSGGAVLMPPNTSMVRGTESIQGYFTNRFGEGATGLEITMGDLGGAGPVAYVNGNYALRIQPPGGGPEGRDRGKFLWVLRKLGGNWRLEYVIFSSDLPPAPPAASPGQG